MADQDQGARLVRIDDLRRCLAIAFERLQLTPEDAEGLGGLLVDSELRGHPDHGVAALGLLAGFYRDGKLNPRPRVRVLQETDGAILLDGDRGCGPGAPTRAMRWCIERARERKGMAVAAIRDWQLLVAAPYARLAAEAGLIGFACTNFVPLVAPPGGRTAVFGTNPFAYGLPAQRHHASGPGRRHDRELDAEGPRRRPAGRTDAGRGHLRPRRASDHRPGSVSQGWVAGAAGHPARATQGLRPGVVHRRIERRAERRRVRARASPTARQETSCGPSTSRRSCHGRSSWSGWTHSLTRSSRARGYRASRSCWSPASADSDATWTSPPAASWRWRQRVGSSWRRGASRWPSHCPPSSTTDA